MQTNFFARMVTMTINVSPIQRLLAVFAIASTFFACSNDELSNLQSGEPSSNSTGQQDEQVFCRLNSGTCSQVSLSTCMEFVEAGTARIVSSCNDEPPPPTPSSSSVPPQSSPSATPTCGAQTYNSSYEFCFSNTVYDKCGGRDYNPSAQFCSNSTTTLCSYSPNMYIDQVCSDYRTVFIKCNGNEYNPRVKFCYSNKIYDKCGSSLLFPEEYNPATQFCAGIYQKVYDKCGGNEYNPDSQFCFTKTTCGAFDLVCPSSIVYDKCGRGNEYNPTIEICKDGVVQPK